MRTKKILNKQKSISHKSLLRINKCTNIEDLMKLEGDLINTVRNALANKEKANNVELKSLDNSLQEVIDYHKSILMRKLRFIYVRYSQAVENSINKNNMTYILFDERESTWKLKVYKLLACIAERQTMESIISRMIDRTRENPWQIHLTEVEETKDVFAEIFGGESTLKNITFGHLVFAAKEFEIVNDTSSSSLTLK